MIPVYIMTNISFGTQKRLQFSLSFWLTLQVLNGLLSRDNQKEAISIPIGIIPAGSDNSLVWTVLGVRDPISAAIAIVKVSCNSNSILASLAADFLTQDSVHQIN